MVLYEDKCVNCPPEMGCFGKNCPYLHVPVYYCDVCFEDNAVYRIDGTYYCENCAKEQLKLLFENLSMSEQAEALGVDYKKEESY